MPATDSSRGSTATTEGIRIDVRPRFVAEHSITEPPPGENPRFVFVYHISITNAGPFEVQLLTRRWLIVDADGEQHIVEGDGVVGQQPRLSPGRRFEYESFCPLPTPWGTMEGVFQLKVVQGPEAGRMIDARIERFFLAGPAA